MRIAVIGTGIAGLGAAHLLSTVHEVDLFEASGEIGGQFNMAKRIPGKEEFHETLRYYRTKLAKLGVAMDDIEVVTVPGALEIPLALQKLAGTGRFDALVALGAAAIIVLRVLWGALQALRAGRMVAA